MDGEKMSKILKFISLDAFFLYTKISHRSAIKKLKKISKQIQI